MFIKSWRFACSFAQCLFRSTVAGQGIPVDNFPGSDTVQTLGKDAVPPKAIEKTGDTKRKIVSTDSLHRLYRCVKLLLTQLQDCVREGSNVEAAQIVACLVTNSGMCKLLTDNPETNPRLAELQSYNGDELYRMAEKLRYSCGDFWSKKTSTSDGTPDGIPRSEVAKLNEKMDVMFAMIERASQSSKRTARKLASKQLNG